MHTLELLEQATAVANRLGYGVRQEWLGGCGGGACEVAGRRWIFVDLSLTTAERLDQILDALREDPGIVSLELPAGLARLLGVRRAA
jgi:hypothetical protein